jgi:hypothetical protein
VVDYQTRSGNGGHGMAICTLIMGCGNDPLAQRPGDASSGHPGLCNSSGEGTRCPRHFNTM